MKRQRRHRVEAVSHDRWLISYADFITLLFAFFVTLYAISTVDHRKMQKAVTGFQQAFTEWHPASDGPLLPGRPGGPLHLTMTARFLGGDGALQQVKAHLLARLQQIGEQRVDLTIDPRGLVISVREAGSFPIGRAELDDESRRLFHEIGVTLVEVPNAVRVEGHTDDVPIHSARFGSNWELSTARATAVVAYFVQEVGIGPDRLSAAGYAEYHPRAANDSGEHRARNRRVDIVVLNPQTRDREEPVAGTPAAR
jgi:chemotaxis protein MotB